MKKFQIVKESLLAALLTLIITYGVSFIPLKYEFSKAIRQEFLGFDIYDLYYTGKHLKNTKRDDSIILVEIGDSRAAIADQINLIEKYGPSVIGIDAVFDKDGNALENAGFVSAINQYKNIIFGKRYSIDSLTRLPVFIGNFFEKDSRLYSSGYINFLGNQFSVIRNYPPFLRTADSLYPSFTSAIIDKFSPGKLEKLKERKRDAEIINYQGNIENYNSLTAAQLLYFDSTGQLTNLLYGKIVLMGYFVTNPPFVLEDLHFSPLNEQMAGKSFPDMYGVVIHANILSMIISGCYAKETSVVISYLLAGLIITFFLYYIISKHKRGRHPSHGKFLLVQFLLIVVILYVFLMVFNWFLIKIPLLPIMIALVLCLELFGLYKIIASWLHKKFNYTTVFSHKHAV